MSKQQESLVQGSPKRTTNIFMSKPNHVKRHMMIAHRIRDVIDDQRTLDHDQNKPVFLKSESLPPLTASYRLNHDIREITRIEAQLNKEITKCEFGEEEKKALLKEVIAKCEAMKTQFANSEAAFLQYEKDLAFHKQVLEAEVRDKKQHEMSLQRYLVAGESLMKIREIMNNVIAENQCYYDFLQQVSTGSGINAIGNFIERFETHISTRDKLSQYLNEAIERSEIIKSQLRKKKDDWEQNLAFDIEKLQNIHLKATSANIMNYKYEEALNNININSNEKQVEINRVLKSAEQIIENLIERNALGKSYRKKTLAQQFEAIREDYLKRKAIIHEYEKAKIQVEQKKSRRLALYNKYSKGTLVSREEDQRLVQLFEKKRMLTVRNKYNDYHKMEKRSLLLIDESMTKDYDPLADERNVVKLEGGRKGSFMLVESDEMDESDSNSDELELNMLDDTETSYEEVDFEDLEKNSFLEKSDSDIFRVSSGSTVGSTTPSSSMAVSQSICTFMKAKRKQSWI
uniref:DUF4200 domain-containing protein n=1 Tax=Lygus hesperus TaxID=30085 RepID=A0A0A9W092_LYGHE